MKPAVKYRMENFLCECGMSLVVSEWQGQSISEKLFRVQCSRKQCPKFKPMPYATHSFSEAIDAWKARIIMENME